MTRFTEILAAGLQQGQGVKDGARTAAAADSSEKGLRIDYTQTRVVDVSREYLAERRVIAGFDPGPIMDVYKIMCVQVLQALRARNGNALAVVSPGEAEGKTLTAINLALSLAQEVDRTVLLVDANLRSPAVHKYFGFTPEAGLCDHLLESKPLNEILVNPGIDRFVILPGGRPVMSSAEMLGSIKMAKLVEELTKRYKARIIVFDLPPVLAYADDIAFAPLVDVAVMVARERRTRREDMVRAAAMLKGVPLVGTILNMAGEAAVKRAARPSRRWWARWPRSRA